MSVRFGPKQWEGAAGINWERQEVEHVGMRAHSQRSEHRVVSIEYSNP